MRHRYSMITNILDRRTHLHRWRKIDAVAEATWHDNQQPADGALHDNADSAASIALGDTYAVRRGLSVTGALAWANAYPDEVTLYLYDEGTYELDEG
ncbi:MAG: hypothetical protein EON91_09500 [Brevundimonas sp.]|uniref:hypothetical protein n=1 Tax=Brevundimonas sp. TaxID=1871086 RepID=UPI001229DDC2|nr:hypothetical protein [Brevundimonas sp.]RZJ17416.1 MAG: hypothetical protein EON91_09500 [Brevundimonas sp.]